MGSAGRSHVQLIGEGIELLVEPLARLVFVVLLRLRGVVVPAETALQFGHVAGGGVLRGLGAVRADTRSDRRPERDRGEGDRGPGRDPGRFDFPRHGSSAPDAQTCFRPRVDNEQLRVRGARMRESRADTARTAASPWRATEGRDMSELSCRSCHWRGPGGYVARSARANSGSTRSSSRRNVWRDLPAIRLHPVQGDDPRGRDVHALSTAALAAIGVALAPPVLDFAKTVAWKDAIVSRLSTGVGGCSTRRGCATIRGRATSSTARLRSPIPTPATSASSASTSCSRPAPSPSKLAALPFGGDILLDRTRSR